MTYTLIKGSLHIHYPANPRRGPEPDGDTLKFLPDNRQLIENLPRANRPPRFTQSGITTLRFEGIDALETHFSIEGEEYHQQMDLALAARDVLLEQSGFGNITYFQDNEFKVETVEHHPIRGYILSNGLDTYGRTIAFVFTGEHNEQDGSHIFVTPDMLKDSLNVYLLEQGQAYPAFYLTLPAELRESLIEIVRVARSTPTGLWASATASTTQSAVIHGLAELQELVIWPKLFRRLTAFFQDGYVDLGDLDSWLRNDPRDRDDRLLLPNRELGNMHDLILVSGNSIRLAHRPEDIVIVPDDFILPETPVASANIPHSGPGFVRIIAALVNPHTQPERGNETVTILNTTDVDIDLANWTLADRHGQQSLTGVLPSGEARRKKLSANIQLSNERDTITLLNPEDQIVDQVAYEPRNLPAEGYTIVF